MPELFYINPFHPFIERNGIRGILIDASTLLRIPDDAVLCRKAIMEGAPITMPDLVNELGNHTTRTLLEGHGILDYDPRGEDMFSRTRGLLSLSGDESHLVTLGRATVLILGAGAIGSHVAWMLSAYGIGRLVILDDDDVENSNLNRQLLYTMDDIGRRKVEALSDHLTQVRPDLEVTMLDMRLVSVEQLRGLIADIHPQAVVKALDTPEDASTWINTACVEAQVPYTTGGFVQLDAVVGPTYLPKRTPCLDCFIQPEESIQRLSGRGGTNSSMTEFAASLMTDEIIRIVTGRLPVEMARMTLRHSANGSIEHRPLEFVKRCSTCGATHTVRSRSIWRSIAALIWGLVLCSLPFLVTMPSWSMPRTLAYWAVCAGLTLCLPRAHRGAIIALTAIVYATLNYAMTLRFNAQILQLGSLPIPLAIARAVVGYVMEVCIAAMIMVVLAAFVQATAGLADRFLRQHPTPLEAEA